MARDYASEALCVNGYGQITKSDNRLSRNYLKGTQGNETHVVLAAVGYFLPRY